MKKRVMKYTAFLMSICLFLVVVLAPTQPVRATVFTFNPVADAPVREERPDSNLGGFYQLKAWASPENISFLRFDVQNLDAPVTAATLRLYTLDSSASGIAVQAVADNSWNEMTITYNNAPPAGSVINTSGAMAAQSWVEVDVTSTVTGEGVFSLAVTTADTNLLRFFSKEGTYAPELVIETGSGSSTPTPPPALNADFTAVPVSGNAPLAVTFSDNSTGTITGYDWDFGDGGDSTQPSPAHTYTQPGIYTVSLTVTGAGGGQDTRTRPNYIIVNPASAEIPNASPVITITNPIQAAVLGSYSVLVEGEVADDGTVQSVLVNEVPANVVGNSFSANITVGGGNQTINAVAEDDDGAMGFDSTVVRVDDEGPIIDIDQPPHRRSVYSLTPNVDINYHDFLSSVNAGTVLVQLTDANNVTTDITGDLVVTAQAANGTLSTPLVNNSSYTLTVTIADALGNSSSAQSIFHVASGVTTPPEPANAAWASGVVYNSGTCNEHLTTCAGLPGVQVTAAEIDPETRETTPVSGTIVSGPDGFFAFPFDKTGFFTLRFEKDGYTYGQREVAVVRERSTATNAIYLTLLDSEVTPCTSSGCTHANLEDTIQIEIPPAAIAEGETVSVTATLFNQVEFLPGGQLPPGTEETYAFNLGGDADYEFQKPVKIKIKNSRGFAPGASIPLGYWNPDTLQWEHAGSGLVDATGEWVEMKVTHFSNFDCNYGAPSYSLFNFFLDLFSQLFSCPEGEEGCFISYRTGVLQEWIDLPGVQTAGDTVAPQLRYSTGRANGSALIEAQLDVDVIGNIDIDHIQWELFIEGEKTDNYTLASDFEDTGEIGRFRFLWDGRNAQGERLPAGTYNYAVHIGVPVASQYCGTLNNIFGGPVDCERWPTNSFITRTQNLWQHGTVLLEDAPDSPYGQGWLLAEQQQVHEDEAGNILVTEANDTAAYYAAAADQLQGKGQYNVEQPLVLAPAAAVPVVPLPTSGTYVSGTIAIDTTWSAAQSPYIVTTDVTVTDNVTLTIEPDVQVMFAQNQSLIVAGALSAVGSETQPITFTAYSDGPFLSWDKFPLNDSLTQRATVDNDGDIWFAGFEDDGSGGLFLSAERLDSNGVWTAFDTPSSFAVSPQNIFGIATDSLNQVWVATDDGVAMLDPGGPTWTAYKSDGINLLSDLVLAVAVDAADNIWFGTDSGVSQLTLSGWNTYTTNDGLASNMVYAVALDEDNVWFGTDAGLSRLDGSGYWSTYNTNNSTILGDVVDDLAVDDQNNIWMINHDASGLGLGVSVHIASGGWVTYTVENSGLASSFVRTIAVDSNGRKWIGYEMGDGISVLSADNAIWDHATTPNLASGNIVDIAPAPNGDVWLVHGDSVSETTRGYGGAGVFFDGTIQSGFWKTLQIGGGAVSDDSNGSRLSYVTIEAGGSGALPSLYLHQSSPTLDHITVWGSGGDGFYAFESDGFTLTDSDIFGNRTNGIRIEGGSGGHYLDNLTVQANQGNGVHLNHPGSITVDNALIGDNYEHGIFTEQSDNALLLTNSTIAGNNVPARLAVNAQWQTNNTWSDNTHHRLEWIAGTMTEDRTWTSYFETHFVLGDITVPDGVSFTIEAGTHVQFEASYGLDVQGTLLAVGTFNEPIYFDSVEDWLWDGLRLGGGITDSDSSHLEYVIIQDAETGLFIESTRPALAYLTFVDNGSGLRVINSAGLIIVDSNFQGNGIGVNNATPTLSITAVNNYWGSPTGPTHASNPNGLGDNVTDGVVFDPWRGPVFMDGINPFMENLAGTDQSVLTFDMTTGVYMRTYPGGRHVVFDSEGRHDYTLYANGRQVDYIYNADGTTASMRVIAPGESEPDWVWTFGYVDGKLDSVTDPAGQVTDITIDDNGQLTAVAFADGSAESFFYDARGLLTQHVDKNGAVATYAYDDYGRIQSDTRPIREVYDPATEQTSPLSEQRLYTPSDTAYHLMNESAVGDPDSPAAAAPLSTDLVDSVSYGRGEVRGLTNEWGSWTERTDALGRTTFYERDEANQITSLTMPNGDCMRSTYTERGQIDSLMRIEAAECEQEEPSNTQTAVITYEPRFGQIKTYADPAGNITTYVYDYEEGVGEQGHLIRIEYPPVTDENGVLVAPMAHYTYNSQGLMETATDPRGTVTRYVYTQGTPDEAAGNFNARFAIGVTPVPGLLTQKILDDGGLALTTTYEQFDARGNPQKITGPNPDNITYLAYDEFSRVTVESDPLGIITRYTYDQDGNLVARIEDYTTDGTTGRNVTTLYAYDGEGNMLHERTIADGLVVQTSYFYDINGNRIAEVDGLNNVTSYQYDDGNWLRQYIDATEAVTAYDYDENDRLEYLIDGDGYVARTIYDEFGRVAATIQDSGPNGLNLVTSYTHDLNDNVITMTTPDDAVTCYEYDSWNRLTAVVEDCGGNGFNLRTEFAYDLNNNLVTKTDHRGIVTFYEYDALNRLVRMREDDGGLNRETTYAYDTDGNLATMTDPRGVVTAYTYDEMNRTETSCADATGLNLCTTYGYDRLGYLQSVTDPNNVTEFTIYNAFGLLEQIIADYNGVHAATQYQYDDALNPIRHTDDNNNSTIYTYTPRYQVERETYADGTTVDYTYDGRGNVSTQIDQANETLTFAYDGAGRLTDTTFSTGGSQSFAYDGMGRLTQAAETANGHQSVLTFAYNNLGDVTETTQMLDGIGGATWQVDYTYDYAGGTYAVDYPSGVKAVYALDPLERLDSVYQDNGGLSLVGDYTYDDLNSFYEISYGNNTVNHFAYDPLYRTTSAQLSSGPLTLANYAYGYDLAGNRTYMQRLHKTGTPADVYQYDGLYQLTQVWYGANSISPAAITSYDDQHTYTLDTLGNRLDVAYDDGSQTIFQQYGPNNTAQLTDPMNRYTAVDGTPLNYDPRGNTLSDGVTGNNYTYDILSRQTNVSHSSASAEYIYDAMGRRIAKDVNGALTYFIYDDRFRVIEERSSATTLEARYTYGAGVDEPLMMERNGSTYYLHRDALGSITEVTNSGGSPVERYEYDVYGQPSFFDGSYNAITASALGNPYLFTGRRYDTESGNYYYRARFYSPALGRFLSMDPLGYAAGDANLYRYVFNSPVNYTDPSGQIIETLLDAVIVGYDIYHIFTVDPDTLSDCEKDRLINGFMLDLVSLAIPFLPAAFGPGMHAAGHIDDIGDIGRIANHLDDPLDTARAAENATDVAGIADKTEDAGDFVQVTNQANNTSAKTGIVVRPRGTLGPDDAGHFAVYTDIDGDIQVRGFWPQEEGLPQEGLFDYLFNNRHPGEVRDDLAIISHTDMDGVVHASRTVPLEEAQKLRTLLGEPGSRNSYYSFNPDNFDETYNCVTWGCSQINRVYESEIPSIRQGRIKLALPTISNLPSPWSISIGGK